jgi:hypothetical protein
MKALKIAAAIAALTISSMASADYISWKNNNGAAVTYSSLASASTDGQAYTFEFINSSDDIRLNVKLAGSTKMYTSFGTDWFTTGTNHGTTGVVDSIKLIDNGQVNKSYFADSNSNSFSNISAVVALSKIQYTFTLVDAPDNLVGSGSIGYGQNGPSAVPVPAAAWLMGSGLVGLAGLARRRKI